jgi:hypothetical protein
LVDTAVRRALPPDCLLAEPGDLLGKAPCKIRHAFYTAPTDGQARLINMLVLPYSFPLSKGSQKRLVALKDAVFAGNRVLAVIVEDKHIAVAGRVSWFVARNLHVSSPNFLWIPVCRTEECKVMINMWTYQPLDEMIRDLRTGHLGYFNPGAGVQRPNTEIMMAECPDCGSKVKIVTGIIFPNHRYSRWDYTDWHLFHYVRPIAELPACSATALQEQTAQLRLHDPLITPLEMHDFKDGYPCRLAADCPHCHQVIDSDYVKDRRRRYITSELTKASGTFEYHVLSTPPR